MAFEHRKSRILPRRQYYLRVLRFACFGFILMGFSLGLGLLGYHYICQLSWLDSLLNASMILTGMGPVDPMITNDSKIFASLYALYSGVAFLSIVATFLAPVVHRFLHRLHVDNE